MSTTQPATVAGTSSAPVARKPQAYRRFITSALHARFVHAALVSLVLSWLDASVLGPKNGDTPSPLSTYGCKLTDAGLFSWWFPFGGPGIKALVYFMANLFIFFLQISTLTVGRPISRSPWAFVRSLIRLDTIQTFFWYFASAFWFSEAYIWSNPSMSWITPGGNGRQDLLNEQPIYLRSVLVVLSWTHACRHLYYGHSSLRIPTSPPSTPPSTDTRTHPLARRSARLKQESLAILVRSSLATALVFVASPFIYALILRSPMWRLHLMLAKPFWNLSRTNATATGIPPIWSTAWPAVTTAFWLSVTWEMCSLLFVTYLTQEPLKKEKPLSAASKDPNGTLLNGLKAKRDLVKTFAFWELALIAQSNAERRKAIFVDIDRTTGPIWPQMLQEALKVLKDLDTRVTPPKPPTEPSKEKQKPTEQLPKIVPEVRGGNIFAVTPPGSTAKRLQSFVGGEMKRLGSSPETWRPQLDKAVKMIEQSKPELANSVKKDLQQSPAGTFFKTTNAAKINAEVLGSPNSSAALLVDAVEAVTRMLLASLQEDVYGNSIKCVPSAVKQFTTSITLTEAFVDANPPGQGNIADVQVLLARLKSGLRELLSAFQVYLNDQALGIAELNAAKRASGEQTIQAEKRKELQLEDAPRQQQIESAPERPPEPWRSFGRHGGNAALPAGDAPARLFVRQEQPKQASRTVHIPRRREMEQVR
jgi:nucleoporin NDC1